MPLHERHLAHQQQGDTGSLHNDYAEHAVVEDSMYSASFIGREAILARKGIGMAAIPDLQIQVTTRLAHGPQVIVEWSAAGTHTRNFPGLPSSGRPFSIRGVTVVVRHPWRSSRRYIVLSLTSCPTRSSKARWISAAVAISPLCARTKNGATKCCSSWHRSKRRPDDLPSQESQPHSLPSDCRARCAF
jgi:steroid delta-isomerase-like uncharacterized protein